MSRRTERISSLIRTIVARAIHDRLSDPRIEPLTSVTRVEVTADLSLARVFVSVLAEPARRRLSLRALRHAGGRLRSIVADQVQLRQVPRLEFVLDESLRRGFETVQVLDRLMDATHAEPAPDAGEASLTQPRGELSDAGSNPVNPAALDPQVPPDRTPEP